MTRAELKEKKIAVLLGGLSAEREISLRTGRAVLTSLERSGLQAVPLDAGRDLAQRLDALKPDIVFIALHGRYGEDGTVQGLLELLGIPYTGSGVLASSIAIDKVTTKKLLIHHDIPTPAFYVYRRGDDLAALLDRIDHWPVIAKPAREGSTIGVTIADDRDKLAAGIDEGLRYDETILIEEFIQGDEATVSILDGEPLPVIQVVPKGGFYNFTAKYTAGQTEYLLPAPFESGLYTRLQQLGSRAFTALGCQGAARVDFMIRGTELFCLEVNTIPGMTETSLLPKAAACAGISFDELVLRILDGARTAK